MTGRVLAGIFVASGLGGGGFGCGRASCSLAGRGSKGEVPAVPTAGGTREGGDPEWARKARRT